MSKNIASENYFALKCPSPYLDSFKLSPFYLACKKWPATFARCRKFQPLAVFIAQYSKALRSRFLGE
jgi:hypothetical protein